MGKGYDRGWKDLESNNRIGYIVRIVILEWAHGANDNIRRG